MISLYKISEVAGKLNVETYVIFEKLLTHADLFKEHTQKVHSINYIDDVGIEIIKALIEGKSKSEILSGINNREPLDEPEEMESTEVNDEPIESNFSQEMEDEDWLTEEDLVLIDAEKQKLRDEIGQLRRQLIQYDSELKRLDDAILNYQILMREDVDYLLETEEKLEQKLFHKAVMDKGEELPTNKFGFRRK